MNRIGLIAGRGRFPLVFARAAAEKGVKVVALAVRGDANPGIKRIVDKTYWLNFNELSKVAQILLEEGINQAVMAGQINPAHLFNKKIYDDPELKEIICRLDNKKADTLFSAIIDNIESKGIKFLDSSLFLEDYFPEKGLLGSSVPSAPEWKDINFGFEIAKVIGGIDIGQTVCVKDQAIVAVEALEGTDNTIKRAGRISRGGFSAIKVSKPDQDMRFDVPVVGMGTLKALKSANGKCLAIEAKKTLVLDKEDFIKFADRNKIAVAAV